MKKFAGLICNFLPVGVRADTLEGKSYTVVPMVILTEGVHNGSQGALYYPPDELSKTPASWDHKPIVIYHPTANGQGISACQPEVLNTRKVGLMLNTKFEGGKLKSEAWIDSARADAVDERVMLAVNSKEMMELSTGVFIDVEETTGKWKSEAYTGVARNYRPDHLALLPDQIGACSVEDGAGLLRNSLHGKGPLGKGLISALVKMGLVDNEMSFSNVHSALSTALREKFPAVNNDGPWLWVADVFSNFVIYEKDGKLWRLGYMSNDTGVTLSDETPVEVRRVTEYRTVQGALVGNHRPATEPNNNMKTIKEKVDGIIAANAGWVETDRENLMACNEAQLDAMHAMHTALPGATFAGFNLERKDGKVSMVVKNTAAPAVPPVVAAPAVVVPPATPASNAKVVTVAEYIAGAPREVQEVLSNSLTVYNEEKVKLVESIMACANNGFTKDDLNNRPLGELRNLARLAQSTSAQPAFVPHYAGMAPLTENAGKEEALEVPSMNFEKQKAA